MSLLFIFERYKCSKFEHMKNEQDQFEVLRKIKQDPVFHKEN